MKWRQGHQVSGLVSHINVCQSKIVTPPARILFVCLHRTVNTMKMYHWSGLSNHAERTSLKLKMLSERKCLNVLTFFVYHLITSIKTTHLHPSVSKSETYLCMQPYRYITEADSLSWAEKLLQRKVTQISCGNNSLLGTQNRTHSCKSGTSCKGRGQENLWKH